MSRNCCAGGRSGYPSDLQTALQKLHVTHSEDRDQTEKLFDSETSHAVSSRTRSKVSCGGVSRGASGHREEIVYEDTGSRDGGASMENDVVHPAARGGGATFGAQRRASLVCAGSNPTSDDDYYSENGNQDGGSNTDVSCVEEYEQRSESEDGDALTLWQDCDSEVTIKRSQPKATLAAEKQPLQRGDENIRKQRSDKRVQKISHDKGSKVRKSVDSPAVQTYSLMRDRSSQPMPRRKRHAADVEASVDRRHRVTRSEAGIKLASRPIKVMQSG